MKRSKRLPVPKKMRDKILVEFNHRCVCCNAPYHEVHHIDGNRSNNAEDNLIVLCPNCHQGKVHGNSITITPEQLKLYKITRSKAIFKPIYNAVKNRIKFIETDEYENLTYDDIIEKVQDLINYIDTLTQGTYYGKKLKRLLSREPCIYVLGSPSHIYNQQTREIEKRYKKKIREKKEEILKLVFECIEIQ